MSPCVLTATTGGSRNWRPMRQQSGRSSNAASKRVNEREQQGNRTLGATRVLERVLWAAARFGPPLPGVPLVDDADPGRTVWPGDFPNALLERTRLRPG